MSDLDDQGRPEPLAILRRATDEFGRRVPSDRLRLGASTPCEGWSVRDLLQHVVVGNRISVAMLDGGTRQAVDAARAEMAALDQLGNDPRAAFDASAQAQIAAFSRPGALEAPCQSAVGEVAGRVLLGFRIGDLAIHAWDLARALGDDESLDDAVVAWVYDSMEAAAPAIAKTGRFGAGPSGQVAADAPVLQRLLDLSGRRP